MAPKNNGPVLFPDCYFTETIYCFLLLRMARMPGGGGGGGAAGYSNTDFG